MSTLCRWAVGSAMAVIIVYAGEPFLCFIQVALHQAGLSSEMSEN